MGFKRIFGQEINKDLLIDFLNDLLKGQRRVCDIRFLDKELLGTTVEDRNCIYDIYCRDERGAEFIVEMQNRQQANFRDRALYYVSRAISNQGEKGSDWKFRLMPVYGVFFMNFRSELPFQQFRADVTLRDEATNKLFSDNIHLIFLQMPLFTKEEHECENDFERWIYVLKHMETLERMPFKARKAVFKRLEDVVTLASLNKAERRLYEENLKVYRDNLATEAYAVDYGMRKGREEGRAEGLAEGERVGEKKERLKNARGMKAEGIPSELIAKITGLSLQEIEAL